MKKFTVNRKGMHYLDKGQGPVLVFGHSFLWDSQMWLPQIDVLSQFYRCIVPDLWSHGQSESMPAGIQNLQDYARNILSLLDHLSIDTFSVIGLSVGGMWGVELALMAETRVRSLVIMGTFLGSEPEKTQAAYMNMLDTVEKARHIPAPLIDRLIPLFFAADVHDKNTELVQRFKTALLSISGERAVDTARIGRMIFGRRDALSDLGRLRLPVMVMAGEEDVPRPVSEAKLMHGLIRDSEYVEIKNAGHIANLEQAEFVTDKLCGFLKSCVRRTVEVACISGKSEN